jgi:hypothetical protein
LIRKAFPFLAAALFVSTAGSAAAQSPTEAPPTAFAKQLHRMDLAFTGVGEYNTTVTGPVLSKAASDYGNGANTMTQYGSNTFGALITLRYIAHPWVGFELNYGYARYTENYTGPAVLTFSSDGLFQIQTKASEYTLGYVATPQRFKPLGLQPYFGAGAGSLAFKPTPHGGEGEPEKARMAYYYDLGIQQEFLNNHVGLRAGFRELFFLDPDFGQNYLTILKHASTYEPVAGFYFRY